MPVLYDLFQHMVGANRWRRRVIEERVLPALAIGAAVIDIGCGTGEVLNYLPNTLCYMGFDRNPQYIADARRRFVGRNASFHCEELTPSYRGVDSSADCVLALGLLHHLDNESANALFKTARAALRPGGFLLTLDPLYMEGQSSLARYIISRDRGTEVRNEKAYVELAQTCFSSVDVLVDRSPLRIPYTGIVLKCRP